MSTSTEAYQQAKATGQIGRQQQAVLALVEAYPNSTGAELGEHAEDEGFDELGPDHRYAVSRRLPELARQGHVERCGERKCTVTNRKATVWRKRVTRTCAAVGAHLMCNAEKYWERKGRRYQCRACGKFLGYAKD